MSILAALPCEKVYCALLWVFFECIGKNDMSFLTTLLSLMHLRLASKTSVLLLALLMDKYRSW